MGLIETRFVSHEEINVPVSEVRRILEQEFEQLYLQTTQFPHMQERAIGALVEQLIVDADQDLPRIFKRIESDPEIVEWLHQEMRGPMPFFPLRYRFSLTAVPAVLGEITVLGVEVQVMHLQGERLDQPHELRDESEWIPYREGIAATMNARLAKQLTPQDLVAYLLAGGVEQWLKWSVKRYLEEAFSV